MEKWRECPEKEETDHLKKVLKIINESIYWNGLENIDQE